MIKKFKLLVFLIIFFIMMFMLSGCDITFLPNPLNYFFNRNPIESNEYSMFDFKFDNYTEGYKLAEYKGDSSDVTIPAVYDNKPVTIIGLRAFYENSTLISINIPDSVINIENLAFAGCSSLVSVTIPNSITNIGNSAFIDCSSLSNLNFENNSQLRIIGFSAFENCSSLTSITIPNSVTSIHSSAFRDCSSLTNITISNSVTTISNTFQNCYSLTTVSFGENSQLTSIGYGAFMYCSSLTGITIPNGVTSIGYGAFMYCNSLTSITIPNGVTSIGYGAFMYCNSLTGITIPNSVTSIGDSAFRDCSSLTSITIPNSVTSIGDNAFRGCNSLISITIPNNVTSIGDSVFRNCSSLASVTISDSVTSLGDAVFSACNSLTSITIPNSVTSIGDSAFSACGSLTSITIPNSVTSIGNSAFYGCKSLANIIIPDSVTSIGNSLFRDCSSLTSITIPNSVTSIGDSAFRDCSSLISITIPNSVTSIGTGTFQCSGLTNIFIPISVTSMGNDEILGCNRVTILYAEATDRPSEWQYYEDRVYWGVNINNLIEENGMQFLLHNDKVTLTRYLGNNTIIEIPFTVKIGNISKDVTSIGSYAFSNCNSLTSITIPNSVTSIGDSAFSSCNNLISIAIPDSVISIGRDAFAGIFTARMALTSITFGENSQLTNISSSVFAYCSSLINITIPNSVTSIADNAFFYCDSLESIEVIEQNNNYKSVEGVLFNKDGSTLIKYPQGNTRISYSIPEGVINIDSLAFSECNNLISITIPDSVTNIDLAFNYCYSLESIEVIEQNNNYKSVEGVLFNKDGSTLIKYPQGNTRISYSIPEGVINIDSLAFSECNNLISIIIPDSVTNIGNSAFSNCGSLTSIIFGKNSQLTSIGSSAFSQCSSLASINIPDHVTIINGWAFYGCSSLTSITIPPTVTNIGWHAFSYCISLTSITILSNSEISIHEEAFIDVNGMTSLNLKRVQNFSGSYLEPIQNLRIYDLSPSFIAEWSTSYVFHAEKIYVPIQSIEAYKNAWPSLANKIYPLPEFSVTFYDFDGTPIKTETVYHSLSAKAPTVDDFIYTPMYIYKFNGWGTSYNNVTENLDVHATYDYELRYYDVIFQNWDGTIIKSERVSYGHTLSMPSTPERPGTLQYYYTFLEWDVDPLDFYFVTKDLIITAIYNEHIYTFYIRYIDWDGTQISFEIVEYGSDANYPPQNLTRDSLDPRYYYIFNGWFHPLTNITQDIEVYARYSIYPVILTVTFKDYEDNVIGVAQTYYGEGVFIAPNVPEREGYDFIGWDKPFNNIIEDTIVYAEYTRRSYTVEFYNVGELYYTQQVLHGEDAVMPPVDPTRLPTAKYTYSFKEWQGARWNVVSDRNFLAIYDFIINKYTVDFMDYDQTTKLHSSTVDYGTTAIPPDNPVRESNEPEKYEWLFIGWSLDFSCVEKDFIVYAEYEEIWAEYEVVFNKQNGIGGHDTTIFTYNQPLPFSLAPSLAGYDFDGYYDINGVKYYDNNMQGVINSDITTSITLYAVWEYNGTFLIEIDDYDQITWCNYNNLSNFTVEVIANDAVIDVFVVIANQIILFNVGNIFANLSSQYDYVDLKVVNVEINQECIVMGTDIKSYEVNINPIIANTRYGGGDGSSGNPYRISNIRHFNNISLTSLDGVDTYYSQIDDINLSNYNEQIIFYGNYNGNYKCIYNYNNSLFLQNKGIISNLSISNFNILVNNDEEAFGIISNINYGIISNIIISESTIESNYINALGGIAGINEGIIENSIVEIEIASSGLNVGTIAGENKGLLSNNNISSNTKINVFYCGNLINQRIGGIVGVDYYGTIINNSFYGLISYEGPNSQDIDFAPEIGFIVGCYYISDFDNIFFNNIFNGSWNINGLNIVKYKVFFNYLYYDQAQYASGEAIGRIVEGEY